MPLFGSVAYQNRGKATRPAQAGTPSIVSQSSGQIEISWTAPLFSGGAPITDYKIEYSTNGGSSWTEWPHSPSAATSAIVTGLADFLTYIFRVSALNAVGYGSTSSNSANAEQFNAATGGTVSTVSNYNGTGQTWKVHTFTGSSSLSVSRSITNSSILIVGGGGGGGTGICGTGQATCAGGGGGSGGLINTTQLLSTGSNTVTVGAGALGTGGTSSFASLSCTGGSRGGGGAGGAGGSPGGTNGASGVNACTGGGLDSNITGTNTTYAKGGPGYNGINICGGLQGGTWSSIRGNGGASSQRSGTDYPDGTGFNGISGIVVVAYRIS